MWLTLLVSTLAHAQSPLSFATRGESRWLTEDVEAERFFKFEGEAQGLQLYKGDQVEMIITNGDRVRVKKGTKYGWVSATLLTAEAPTVELDTSNLLKSGSLDVP